MGILSCVVVLLLTALLNSEVESAPRAAPDPLDTRVAVAPSLLLSDTDTVKYAAFSTDFTTGKVRVSTSQDAYDWEDW